MDAELASMIVHSAIIYALKNRDDFLATVMSASPDGPALEPEEKACIIGYLLMMSLSDVHALSLVRVSPN